MSVDSYRPITTSQRLQVPRGHRVYTTRRTVPSERALPEIGDTMESILGPAWSSSIIYDSTESPKDSQTSLVLQHTTLPSLPWTRYRYLETPKGHKFYTTTILIPVDDTSYPIPAEGVAISTVSYLSGVASSLQSSIIVGVQYQEAYGGYRLDVDHMLLPVGPGTDPADSFEEYESLAFTFPAIYPNSTGTPAVPPDTPGVPGFFNGGSQPRRRVVPARVIYEYALTAGTPGPDGSGFLSDPAIWDFDDPTTGPFEVKSWIAEAAGTNFVYQDGSSGSVGSYLNMHFIGQDTINDAFSIYAPGDLYYEVAASSPDATTYAAWVNDGTEIIASRTIHKWYEFYMRRTVYVRAQ